MADVAGVDQEGGLCGECLDARNRLPQRTEGVGVGGPGKADMAVADLEEGERGRRRPRAERMSHRRRGGNAPAQRPENARSGPRHARQETAPVDPVLVASARVVVLFGHHCHPRPKADPTPTALWRRPAERARIPSGHALGDGADQIAVSGA